MLGKLFKYEFKNTSKLMLTVYGIFIISTIISTIGLSTNVLQTDIDRLPLIFQLMFFAVMMLYILSMFALFLVTFVYVCIHFYKTMYSDQGYLTHTLPVKPVALFNVKLTTAWVWMMGSMILFILSIFIMMFGATQGELIDIVLNSPIPQILEQFELVFGMKFLTFVFLMFVMMAFSCASYLLMVYASISIGQLFNQHKIVMAVVAGIVIYVLEQIAGSIILLLSGNSYFNTYVYEGFNVTVSDIMFSTPVVASMIVSLLFAIAFYVTCVVIQKKHLNLD